MRTNKRLLAGLAAAASVLVSVPVSAGETPGTVKRRAMRRRATEIRVKPSAESAGIRAGKQLKIKPELHESVKPAGGRVTEETEKTGIRAGKRLQQKTGIRVIRPAR